MVEQEDFIRRFLEAAPEARASAEQRAAAADFLFAELERNGLAAERWAYRQPNIHPVLDILVPPQRGENILAIIPATIESEDYIVIGGHYDSEAGSPGTDDNASGIAAILQVALTVAQREHRSRHVITVFFDQEEEDTTGSAAFVRQLARRGLTVHSMHNIDMAGWDSDGDGAIELDVPDDAWWALYSEAASTWDIPVTRVTYNSTDHVSFRAAGIDAICLSEAFRAGDGSPHLHRATDTAETINHAYLARNTRIVQRVILSLIAEDAP